MFSALLPLSDSTYIRGTYNSDGCIFSNETATKVKIFDVSGILLKAMSLGGDGAIKNPSSLGYGGIGYANGKIIYQASDNTIKLKTDTGTLLDTQEYSDSTGSVYRSYLSNFKKTLIGVRYQTSSESIRHCVPINSNTIVE